MSPKATHVFSLFVHLVLLAPITATGYRGSGTPYDAAEDQPSQRLALLNIRDDLRGPHLTDDLLAWGGTTSYCLWRRITCCRDAPAGLLRRPCAAPHDVAALDLTSAGLSSSSGPPPNLALLPALAQLLLGGNQGLSGVWPEALLLPALLSLEVQGTSLTFCQQAAPVVEVGQVTTTTPPDGSQEPPAVSGPACRLPQWMQQSSRAPRLSEAGGLECPQMLLVNNTGASSGGGGRSAWSLGPVTADPPAFQWVGCTCRRPKDVLTAASSSRQLLPSPHPGSDGFPAADPEGGEVQAVAVSSLAWSCEDPDEVALAMALKQKSVMLVLVWVLGCLLLWPLLWYPARRFWRVWSGWRRDSAARRPGAKQRTKSHPGSTSGRGLVQEGELSLAAKRSRFPGTPSVALAKGRGLVTLADVMVTWVVTDVEGSTRLWEENAPAMAEAVELHNKVMRGLLPEYGGHEVRTDGDSFTLAFHDALDAVEYCLKAQELLLHVPWPEALLAHDYGRPVYLGEACGGIPLLQPQAAAAAAPGRAGSNGRASLVLAAAGVSDGDSSAGTIRQAQGGAAGQQVVGAPAMESRWEGGEEAADVEGGRDTSLAGLRQRGSLLFRGLRVRMGINTGIPDDIYVHDLTDAVEYRGEEYELAGDLGDMAAGGQILLGPRTFQRWNKVFQQGATEQGPAAAEDTSIRGLTATAAGTAVTAAQGPPALSGAGDSSRVAASKQKSRRFNISGKIGSGAGQEEAALGGVGTLVESSGYSLALSSNYASFTAAGMQPGAAGEAAAGALSGPSWTAAGRKSTRTHSSSGSGVSFMMSPAAALLEGPGGMGGSGELVVVRRSTSASGVQLLTQPLGGHPVSEHWDRGGAPYHLKQGRQSSDNINTMVTLSGVRGCLRSSTSSNSSHSGDAAPAPGLHLTRSSTITNLTSGHATLLHPALAAASGKLPSVKVASGGRGRSSSATAALSLGGGLEEVGTPRMGAAWQAGGGKSRNRANSSNMGACLGKTAADGFKKRLSLLVVGSNEADNTAVMTAATAPLPAVGVVDAAAYVKPAARRKRSSSSGGGRVVAPEALVSGALGSGGGGSGGWTIAASYSCDAEVAGGPSGSGSGVWSPTGGTSHEGNAGSGGGVALSPHLTSRQEVSSEWGHPTKQQHQARPGYSCSVTRALTLDGDSAGEAPEGAAQDTQEGPPADADSAILVSGVAGVRQLLDSSLPFSPTVRRHRSILVVPGHSSAADAAAAAAAVATPRRGNRSVCFVEAPGAAVPDLLFQTALGSTSPTAALGSRGAQHTDTGVDSPRGRTRSLGALPLEVTARPGVGGAGGGAGVGDVTYLRRSSSSQESGDSTEEDGLQGSRVGHRRLRHHGSRTALGGSGGGVDLPTGGTPAVATASWEQPSSSGAVVTVPLLGSGAGMVLAAPTGRHVPRSKRHSSWVAPGLAAGSAYPTAGAVATAGSATSSSRSSGEEQHSQLVPASGSITARPVGEGAEGSSQLYVTHVGPHDASNSTTGVDSPPTTGLMQLPLDVYGQGTPEDWTTRAVTTSLLRLGSAPGGSEEEEAAEVISGPAGGVVVATATRTSASLLQEPAAPEFHDHAYTGSLQLCRGSTWATNPSSEGATNAAAQGAPCPPVQHAAPAAGQTALTVLEENPPSTSGSGNGNNAGARPRASGMWNWLRRSTVGMGSPTNGPSAGGGSGQGGQGSSGWRSWGGVGGLLLAKAAAQPAGHGLASKSRAGLWSVSDPHCSLGRMREDADHVRALLAEQQGDSSEGGGVDEEVVVMDLGYYQWQEEEGEPEDGAADGGGQSHAALRVLHLAQVMSAPLMGRLRLFPWPLPAATGEDAALRQLLPGFWDAPGAGALQSPEMRQLLEGAGGRGSRPARPQVAIVFVCPAGLKTLSAFSQPLAQLCIRIFNATLREVLLAVGGYESKENGGLSMLAFDSAAAALEWALTFQLALLEVPWPEQLLDLPAGAQVTAPFCPDPAALQSLDGMHAPPRISSHSAAASDRSMHKRLGAQGDTTGGDSSGAAGAGSTAAATAGCTTTLRNSGLLPSAPGAAELLGGAPGEEVVVFRGLRARIGVWAGPMDRVVPHSKTGRADYLGQPANRAARLMAAAQGGQILVEQGLGEAVVAGWRRQAAAPRATSSSRSNSSLYQPSGRGTFSTLTGRSSTTSSWWATNPGGGASGMASVPGLPQRVSLTSPYAPGNSGPFPTTQLPGGLAPGALATKGVTKVSPLVSPRPSVDMCSSRPAAHGTGQLARTSPPTILLPTPPPGRGTAPAGARGGGASAACPPDGTATAQAADVPGSPRPQQHQQQQQDALSLGAWHAVDSSHMPLAMHSQSARGGCSAVVSSAGGSSVSFSLMAPSSAPAEADSPSSDEALRLEAAVEAEEAADSLGGLRLASTATAGEELQGSSPHHLNRRDPFSNRATRSSNGAMPRWRLGGSLSGDGSSQMRAGLDPAGRRAMSSNGSSSGGADMGEGGFSTGPRRGRRRCTHDPDPLLVAWCNAAAVSGPGGVEGRKEGGTGTRSSSGAGGLTLSPSGAITRPLLVDLVPVDYDPTRFTLRPASSPNSGGTNSSSGLATRQTVAGAGAERNAMSPAGSSCAGAGLVSRSGDGGWPLSPRAAARGSMFSRISNSWRGPAGLTGSSSGGEERPLAAAAAAPVAEGVEPAPGDGSPRPAVDVTSVLQALGSWDMGAAGHPGLERSGSSASSSSHGPSPRSPRRAAGGGRSWPASELPPVSPRGGSSASPNWMDHSPLSPRGSATHAGQAAAAAGEESRGSSELSSEVLPSGASRPALPRHLRGGAKKRRQNSLAFLINSATAMGPTPASPSAMGLPCIHESSPAGPASCSGRGWEQQQPHLGGAGDHCLAVAGAGDSVWRCHAGDASSSSLSAARRSRSLDLGGPVLPAAHDFSSTSWAPHLDHHQQHGPSRLSMDSSSRPAPSRGPAPWGGPLEAGAAAAAVDTTGARGRRLSALLWGDVPPSHLQAAEYTMPSPAGASGAALAASSGLFATAALAPPGQPSRHLHKSTSASSRITTNRNSSSSSETPPSEQLSPRPSHTAGMVTRVLNRVRASLDIRPSSHALASSPFTSMAATMAGPGQRTSRSTTDSTTSSERRSMDSRPMQLLSGLQEGDGHVAAPLVTTPGPGTPAAAAAGAAAGPDSPGVMAECYKLTSAVPAEGEGGATPLQSITMIKYTNLVQQAGSLPCMTDTERHLMEGAAIAEEAAAAAVAVPVTLHSLGRFSLKGVPDPVAVAQLVPLMLEGRLGQLLPPHLVNKGKVRCLAHTPARLGTTIVLLPDIQQLACCQPMEEGEEEEEEDGREEEEEEESWREEAAEHLGQEGALGRSGPTAQQQVSSYPGGQVGTKVADTLQAAKAAVVGAPGPLVGTLPGAAPVAVAQAALAARRRG